MPLFTSFQMDDQPMNSQLSGDDGKTRKTAFHAAWGVVIYGSLIIVAQSVLRRYASLLPNWVGWVLHLLTWLFIVLMFVTARRYDKRRAAAGKR